MRNSVLNEKMREVDLGVVTCIDSIVRHCEILLDEKTSQAEQEWAKAQVRLNAGIYLNTLNELLLALEEPNFAKNPQNPTACYRIQEATEQCERIAAAVENEKALVNVYENYTTFLRSFDNNQMLNEINALNHVHHVYLQHIGDEVSRLHSMLQGGKEC